MSLKPEVKKFFKGEVKDDKRTLETYSRDASIFKVKPKLVVFPKNAEDIKKLVNFSRQSGESITMRAAGSDMTGGPINTGIIADVSKHLNKIGEVKRDGTWVEPGALYRNFEKKTLKKHLILPCYTASKNLCALGGMIGNNCAGEKTLRYGKMEKYLVESKWIFADGEEYHIKPMRREEISSNPYAQKVFELIEENKELIENARPKVSKNSAGYYLWNVWDGKTFDLNKLLVGSQGTLGILTEAKVTLVPVEKASELFVIFLHDLSQVTELINTILPTNPDSIESYDDATMKLAFKYFPEILKSMKIRHFLSLLLSFIPEFFMVLRGGMPKLVILVEYSGETKREVDQKMESLEKKLDPFHLVSRKTISEEESSKYWTVRRESFNLLRKHLHGSRTAPFIDDVVVKPEDMPEFLPKMREILDEYKLTYTIAGHAGNGNFHIIPLMKKGDKRNLQVVKEVSEKVYNLVREYQGSITGEHNDGLVRTPYLSKMYSPEVLALFKRVKDIFDPHNILNPYKKVGTDPVFWESHLSL